MSIYPNGHGQFWQDTDKYVKRNKSFINLQKKSQLKNFDKHSKHWFEIKKSKQNYICLNKLDWSFNKYQLMEIDLLSLSMIYWAHITYWASSEYYINSCDF